MGRVSVDEMMLSIASVVAARSTCTRLQVGAVLALGFHPVSVGYNGAPAGEQHCDHTFTQHEPCSVSLHAESNALDFSPVYPKDYTLYITHSPCFQCAGRIINSGVSRVVFNQIYRTTHGLDRLGKAGKAWEQLSVW